MRSSRLFSLFATGPVYDPKVKRSAGALYAVVSRNATTTSLLVVNDHLTRTVALPADRALLGAPTGASATWYRWSWNLSAARCRTGRCRST